MLKETGGDPDCVDLKGASGEITCMQFMPTTYRAYAKETTGRVLPATRTNAEYIASLKVEQLVRKGKTDSQIFLAWNAGENAKKCGKGVNKQGVPYDSCKYVKDGLSILARL